MVKSRSLRLFLVVLLLVYSLSPVALAQQAGNIRGMIFDKDFDAPLGDAKLLIAETGQTATSTDEGHFSFTQVEPGKYTVVISKQGYTRQVKADVVVSAGRMTEINAYLSGEFAEMEEFIVQDVQINAGTEAALLELRMDSPALLDSISADLMSKAGAGDAADALKLVSGTTVQEGKYAVVRGLPDRYVNSQMNSVRLPTADMDKRAVQLDQFPSAVIESIQVSKTFTPDQQGDASGGAVNLQLKSIPDEPMLKIGVGYGYDEQPGNKNEFLSYKQGGVNLTGYDSGRRDVPGRMVGKNWDGAVGVSHRDAPEQYKWSIATGGKYEYDEPILLEDWLYEGGFKLGGFLSFYYERDTSYYNDGVDDKYWVKAPGEPMTPQYSQGSPQQGDFKTKLFDVEQGKEELKWGLLTALGVEVEDHALSLLYMYNRSAEDKATVAEDTRGKYYYFPDYDISDPTSEGNQQRDAAPFLRMETLQYTERETQTVQFSGKHTAPVPEMELGKVFKILRPEGDWIVSQSHARMKQPDKRQFGSLWWAPSYNKGFPPYVPPFTSPETYMPFKPAANFTIGNLQRIWKEIHERSEQYSMNAKFPFEQWTGAEGYFKIGVFNDVVHRDYSQDSYSNFGDNKGTTDLPWETHWSWYFNDDEHPIYPADIDVDYVGDQKIYAWYYMTDFPIVSDLPGIYTLNFIGGGRYEKTKLAIVNFPEKDVTWVPPGAPGAIDLLPGESDVNFSQQDFLPSLGFLYKPIEQISLRGTYSQTVARQTFKELTPIQQVEYLGGDVFIGNPFLQMSSLRNYDLRLDFTPFDGSLYSVSWFKKKVTDPIEYVQEVANFAYTTPMNYPTGQLEGVELEARQKMGDLWSGMEGLTLGANATVIESEVTLPEIEAAQFEAPNIMKPMKTRDMTNAPEYLYNAFFTYDLTELGLWGTELNMFYTVRGDTLIAGAGQSKGNYIPNVYETKYGTLNASVSQKIGDHCKVKFSAKNLLDPEIKTVYRSKYLDGDVTKTSYKKGMSFSLGISGSF